MRDHSTSGPDSVAQFVRLIGTRGPDGTGQFSTQYGEHRVALAHTRLAIIDLSETGRQPMTHAESGWSIAYNGEVYNYLEIRQELSNLGEQFVGHSDTEVLLKAWVQWGVDALPRMNGMFAFAAFNDKTGDLWLIRDRFGVKPLLWGRLKDRGLVFSSSVAAVASRLDSPVDVPYLARGVRYMAYETQGEGAPFTQVNSLPAGGWLRAQLRSDAVEITEGYWYRLSDAVERRVEGLAGTDSEPLIDECGALLRDAVKLRLRSDVPLAVSLSGGLDSSSIAALAARDAAALHGFTYGSPSSLESEGPAVQRFADRVGIKASYVWPNYSASGLDNLLERTLRDQEAPFSSLSVLAQNEVFRSVREDGFKVLMGGQGGDEIFAGYRKFFFIAIREAIARRNPWQVIRGFYSLGLMLSHEVSQARVYWNSLDRYGIRQTPEYKLLDWPAPSLNLWGNAGGSLAERQMSDITQWSVPTLLRYEDRNSMGHGLETRLPFMDYRLVETALALPATLKVARGYGKWALRQVTRDLVPNHVRLNRKKRGFDVTQSWISDGIGASLRSRILDNRQTLQGHLRPNVDLIASLSDSSLSRDTRLLDEALALAWLVEPVRQPIATGTE